jgi:hypothetical protein
VPCAPAASCAKVESTRVSHHESTGTTRHSRTQWLYGLLRALPGDRAFLPPCSARHRRRLREVNASVGASGPHGFAVRKYAARRREDHAPATCGHRIPHPTFVTIAKRPSLGVWDGARLKVIWGWTGTEMFLRKGLDRGANQMRSSAFLAVLFGNSAPHFGTFEVLW